DHLADPVTVFPSVDYHAFVDRPFPCRVWNQHRLTAFSTDSRFAARRDAKLYKVLPHLFLPDYDVHFWVDATNEVAVDPRGLVELYLRDHAMAVFRHPERCCTYDEARVVLELDLDHADPVTQQMEHYQALGLPRQWGLYQLSAFIRRNNAESHRLSLRLWDQVRSFSSRDQLSFPFVAWQLQVSLGILYSPVYGPLPGTYEFENNPFIPKVRAHAV